MLKVAIVGCGKIASAHVEQIRATGRGTVVAVCDREELMARQLGERMDVPGRYTDLVQLLEQERPDVVHVATPPASHMAIARTVMESGCHVFMEKPFAPAGAEAQEILDCAQQTGKRLSVNYLYNFEAPTLELEKLVEQRAIGDIVHLDMSYGYNLAGDYGLAVMADPGHWVHSLPGKLFQNVLDHVFAKIVAYLDDDWSMQLESFRRRPESGNPVVDALPDELRFLIRSGNVTASGLISAHARPISHTLKVYGERDSCELDYAARTLVRSAQQTQPSAMGRLFPPWVQARRYAGNAWRNLGRFRRHEFHYFQGMRVLLDRFYDAVEGRGPDPIPHDQILRTCRLIDQVAKGMKDSA